MSIAQSMKRKYVRNKDKDNVLELINVASIDWCYSDNNRINYQFDDGSALQLDENNNSIKLIKEIN